MFYTGETPIRAGAGHRRPATITHRDISPLSTFCPIGCIGVTKSKRMPHERGGRPINSQHKKDRTGGRNVDSVKELTKDNV